MIKQLHNQIVKYNQLINKSNKEAQPKACDDMYAKGKAVNVGKEGLAAEFEKAMETAEGDDWHGFGANDVKGLFHAEIWLYDMKGLIEVKSWDKSELKKAKKKLREFEREVQNDPLQNEKPKMKESQKGKKRKAED